VSVEALALASGILILGSLALFLLGSLLRGVSAALLLAGLGLAAFAARRRRPGAPESGLVRPSGAIDASPSVAVTAAAPGDKEKASSPATPPKAGARLVIAGDGPNREVLLCGDGDGSWPDEIVIGRGVNEGPAALRIASRAVSALQARLRQQAGTFSVENLSKTNRTRVNGRELTAGEKRLLAVGDRIEMGPVTVSFHVR
jgi:hypothetical protein